MDVVCSPQVASILSAYLSVQLTLSLQITSSHYNQLWLMILICNLCKLVPLILVPFLPALPLTEKLNGLSNMYEAQAQKHITARKSSSLESPLLEKLTTEVEESPMEQAATEVP